MKGLTLAIMMIALWYGDALAQMPFSVRRDSVRAFFQGANIGHDYYSAIAKLADSSTRRKGVDVAVSAINATPRTIIDRFRMTALLLHSSQYLPDSAVAKMRTVWATYPPPPPESEHDRVCLATCRYLIALRYGESQEWYNGQPSSRVRAEAREELDEWMRDLTFRGQEEFDSPTYAPLFIASLLLLRDFGNEPALRSRCDVLLNWLLADFALDHYDGQYAGAHSREGHQSAVEPRGSEMSSFAWLYFSSGWQLYTREQFLAAISDFAPHPAVIELARNRRTPFVSIETKPATTRLRGRTPTPRITKYLYMHPLYAIGSMRGGLVSPLEQHTWDVTFATQSSQSSVFTMQPYAALEGLTDFYPGSPQFVHDYIGGLDPFFAAPNKTVGGSPHEDVFQHKNTIIAGYHLPPGTLFPYVTGILPHECKSFEIDSLGTGWIMLDFGDVYMGIFPLANYTLSNNPEGRRLVFRDGWSGCILTVAGRNDVGTFAAFKTKLLQTRGDNTAFVTKGRVTYTTPDGDNLVYLYGGRHTVNGKARSEDPRMLFSSPMARSRVGSGVLSIRYSKGTLTIDATANRLVENGR